MDTSIYSIALVIASTIVGAAGAFLLKKAALGDELTMVSLFNNEKMLGGFGLYGVSSLIFIYALRYGQLSVLYPLVSIVYIWIILISWKLLEERINSYKMIGVFFIMLGVVVLGISS